MLAKQKAWQVGQMVWRTKPLAEGQYPTTVDELASLAGIVVPLSKGELAVMPLFEPHLATMSGWLVGRYTEPLEHYEADLAEALEVMQQELYDRVEKARGLLKKVHETRAMVLTQKIGKSDVLTAYMQERLRRTASEKS